jgi:AcrR family transcriptional regulator
MESLSSTPTTRPYRLGKRAAGQAETRRRIIEATSELHRTVGPAATRISEVARRAGVRRVTVYDHFPDDASLLRACSAHWRDLHPTPDLERWRRFEAPAERLRQGLRELYAWYRETRPMTANILRDAEVLPPLREIVEAGLGAWLDAAARTLAEPFEVGRAARRRLDAALRLALDFRAWRALASLGDREAVELAASFVELAASRP